MANDVTSAQQVLEQHLRSLVSSIESVDLAAPDAAAAQLEERHPTDSSEIASIRELLLEGLRDDWLVLNELHAGVQQGCVHPDLGGYSVSALSIEGMGRGHTHPDGEVGLGFATDGEPRLDGHGPGWVVFPPGSHHAPMVTDGRMLFLFFRPGGQVVWDAMGDRD